MQPEEEHRRGSLTLVEDLLEEEELLWVDEGDDDHTGWFCVRTDPFPCPAAGWPWPAGGGAPPPFSPPTGSRRRRSAGEPWPDTLMTQP